MAGRPGYGGFWADIQCLGNVRRARQAHRGHLILYVPVIFIAVLATAAMTMRSPQAATRIGVGAVAVAVVAVTIADVTGNVLLFYVGALAGPFGVLVLLFRATEVVWRRWSGVGSDVFSGRGR